MAQETLETFDSAQIACNEIWKDVVKEYLLENTDKYNYLYVKHTSNANHWHFYIRTLEGRPRSLNQKNFNTKLRNGIRRLADRKGINTSIAKDNGISITGVGTVEQFLIYIKHENEIGLIELKGPMAEDYKNFFDNIKQDEANNAKEAQKRRRAEYAEEVQHKAKLIKLERVLNLCHEHKIKQLHDFERMPIKSQMDYHAIANIDDLSKRSLSLFSTLRVDFERQCRHTDWTWEEVGMLSYNKMELTEKEKNIIKAGMSDYIAAGVELLHLVMQTNNIKFLDLHEKVTDVMECNRNKKNSLYLVGETNAGKSLISNIICDPFLRATISQAGNASSFIFNEVVGKTCIQIEECTIPTTLAEDYKNLMGGMKSMSVNVKHKNNTTLDVRTPVITTGNKTPWFQWIGHEEETFLNRGYLFKFEKTIPTRKIDEICAKYPEVASTKGEIYLNINHWYAYRKTLDKTQKEQQDIYKQILKEIYHQIQRKDDTMNYITLTRIEHLYNKNKDYTQQEEDDDLTPIESQLMPDFLINDFEDYRTGEGIENGQLLTDDDLSELLGENINTTPDTNKKTKTTKEIWEKEKQKDPKYKSSLENYIERAALILESGRGNNQLELEQLAGVDPRLVSSHKYFKWMRENEIHTWDEIQPLINSSFPQKSIT